MVGDGEPSGEEPSDEDIALLRQAVDLAWRCPPSATFKVGAVVGDRDGAVIATGYSGQGSPHDHAEEVALASLDASDPRLAGATMYSSLEPCSTRASRPRTCTELILLAGIPRIVFAMREPPVFVVCEGARRLREAGRDVVEVPRLAPLVREANAHLPNITSSGDR